MIDGWCGRPFYRIGGIRTCVAAVGTRDAPNRPQDRAQERLAGKQQGRVAARGPSFAFYPVRNLGPVPVVGPLVPDFVIRGPRRGETCVPVELDRTQSGRAAEEIRVVEFIPAQSPDRVPRVPVVGPELRAGVLLGRHDGDRVVGVGKVPVELLGDRLQSEGVVVAIHTIAAEAREDDVHDVAGVLQIGVYLLHARHRQVEGGDRKANGHSLEGVLLVLLGFLFVGVFVVLLDHLGDLERAEVHLWTVEPAAPPADGVPQLRLAPGRIEGAHHLPPEGPRPGAGPGVGHGLAGGARPVLELHRLDVTCYQEVVEGQPFRAVGANQAGLRVEPQRLSVR